MNNNIKVITWIYRSEKILLQRIVFCGVFKVLSCLTLSPVPAQAIPRAIAAPYRT